VKLLALESSTDACSVALAIDGEVTVDHRIAPQTHAQLLLPMINKLLIDAGISTKDLDGVAFGCGPGSFTGVRIAAAATQGIAFGADIGVIPVSSLQALAQGAHRVHSATHVLAVFDARMDEVYWGAYATGAGDGCSKGANSLVQPLQNDRVCSPEHVLAPEDTTANEWILLGSGADQYKEVLLSVIGTNVATRFIHGCCPSAQDVLSLALPLAETGGYQVAANALPVYLRDRVALTEAQRAAGEQLRK